MNDDQIENLSYIIHSDDWPSVVLPLVKRGDHMDSTAATLKRRDFTDDGVKNRQCGIQGIVVATHDSHGLCYDVRHFGKIGCYDPDELTRVPEQVRWTGVL
jgi:hypothetical protein